MPLQDISVVDDFINEAYEQQIFETLCALKSKWEVLNGRQTLQLGGSLTPKGTLIQTPFPDWVQSLIDKISREIGVFNNEDGSQRINHILVNKYDIEGGILPHKDGDCYESTVVILSLMSPVTMKFFSDDHAHTLVDSVILRPRSLLIFKDEAYTKCLHGIQAGRQVEDVVDRDGLVKRVTRSGTRISLTFRRVKKVAPCLIRV